MIFLLVVITALTYTYFTSSDDLRLATMDRLILRRQRGRARQPRDNHKKSSMATQNEPDDQAKIGEFACGECRYRRAGLH